MLLEALQFPSVLQYARNSKGQFCAAAVCKYSLVLAGQAAMVRSENSSLFHIGLFIQTHPACWKTNQQAQIGLLKEGKEHIIISALSVAQSIRNCKVLQYCNTAF